MAADPHQPASQAVDASYSWRRALVWMLALGLMFFTLYPWTNALAARQSGLPVLTLPFDARMPFWAWSIVPYLSINLLYPLTFFLPPDREGLDRYALRVLLAQSVCLAVFLLYPTANGRPRPVVDGWAGALFESLRGFDRPYNMLPSLHLALLVVIWDAWRRVLPRAARLPWLLWCVLIGVAALTTWQHYLLDVAGGLLLGVLVLRIVPEPQRAC